LETITGPVSASIAAEAETRLAKLARFAKADHRIAPAPLRQPFSAMNWNALPEDVRLTHLRERLIVRVIEDRKAKNEKRRARKVAREAAALAEQEAPAPAEEAPASAVEAPAPVEDEAPASAPATASRYVVACVAGCGTFHPAKSGRPVVVTCGAERGQKTRPTGKYSVYSIEDTDELIERFRRAAKANARHQDAPTRQKAANKTPKTRRRAVCANTR